MGKNSSRLCDHCNHSCSPTAKACPNCGHDFQIYTSELFRLLVWITACILLASVFYRSFMPMAAGSVLFTYLGLGILILIITVMLFLWSRNK